MSREALFEAFGEIDESFVAESTKAPSRRPVWLKIAYVAAGLVLVAASSIIACSYTRSAPDSSDHVVSGENAFVATPTTTVDYASYPTRSPLITTAPSSDSQKPLIVTYPAVDNRVVAESAIGPYDMSCYARGPYPGECWIDVYGPAVTDDVNPNLVYWAELSLYNEDGDIRSRDIIQKEAERLALLGFEIYLCDETWTGYWGEEKHLTHLCGFFTKEHLEHFPADPSLGYLIDYCREDLADCVPVTAVSIGDSDRAVCLYPQVYDTFGYDEAQ